MGDLIDQPICAFCGEATTDDPRYVELGVVQIGTLGRNRLRPDGALR